MLYSGVGPLTLSDINLAAATGARLVMFNQQGCASREVEGLLKNLHLPLVSHNVIYHLVDQIKGLVEGKHRCASLSVPGPIETIDGFLCVGNAFY